jgi:hypothetical protein
MHSCRQSFDGCGIHRVGFTEVVRVNNYQLCAGRVSHTLRQSLRRDCNRESGQKKDEQPHTQIERRNHSRLVKHSWFEAKEISVEENWQCSTSFPTTRRGSLAHKCGGFPRTRRSSRENNKRQRGVRLAAFFVGVYPPQVFARANLLVERIDAVVEIIATASPELVALVSRQKSGEELYSQRQRQVSVSLDCPDEPLVNKSWQPG